MTIIEKYYAMNKALNQALAAIDAIEKEVN